MPKRAPLLFWAGLAALLFILAVRFIAPRSDILLPPRASNGVEYVPYAHVPERCRNSACPALYLLDGERWLPSFAQLSEDAAARMAIRPVVVVAIGYRDIAGTAMRRKRDFTPAFGQASEKTGGADAYLEALSHDIIPYAEARLPIERSERGIAGLGYGGLLATYALIREPDLFGAYLIISPNLGFDGGKIFSLTLERAHKPRTVYLASNAGGGPSQNPRRETIQRLNDLLLRDNTLAISQSLFPNKSESDVVEPAARAALPALFPLD